MLRSTSFQISGAVASRWYFWLRFKAFQVVLLSMTRCTIYHKLELSLKSYHDALLACTFLKMCTTCKEYSCANKMLRKLLSLWGVKIFSRFRDVRVQPFLQTSCIVFTVVLNDTYYTGKNRAKVWKNYRKIKLELTLFSCRLTWVIKYTAVTISSFQICCLFFCTNDYTVKL